MAEPGEGQEREVEQETQQPSPLTEARLLEILDERMAAHFTPWRQAFNYLTGIVQEDRAAILEIVGDTKRNRETLDTLFDTTGDPEEREAARKRVAEKLRIEATEAENARLKAERAEAAKLVTPEPDAAAARQYVWAMHERPGLVEYLQEQDTELDFDRDIVAHPKYPKQLVQTRADPEGWDGYRRQIRAIIREVADARREASEERVPVDIGAVRSTGAPAKGLAAYQQALRNGGPLPTPEEIDRLTAVYR